MLKFTAVGNLGRDMEVKEYKDSFVGNFTIGVQVGYGESGSTEWVSCSIWGKRAKSLEPYLKKGTKVVVTGSGSLKSYETKDGETRFNLSIKVDNEGLSFAGSKNTDSKPEETGTPNAYKEMKEAGTPEAFDDEIPF